MQILIHTRAANARQAQATARTAPTRMTMTVMEVNGGELITRVKRDAKGRIQSHSHWFQGRQIRRDLAMKLATEPRTRFRH